MTRLSSGCPSVSLATADRSSRSGISRLWRSTNTLSMDTPQILTNPNGMMGKPVIAGTRITVEHILRELAAGMTIDQLLAMHTHLSREAILAALDYGAGSGR